MMMTGYKGGFETLVLPKLTPDEQYSHITLWSQLSAPLLLGCDMERLDEFTMNLITNDEVITVNQDILGKQAVPVFRKDGFEIWMKDIESEAKAVGIFYTGNSSNSPVEMFNWDNEKTSKKFNLNLRNPGLCGKLKIKDLWRQKDLGKQNTDFEVKIPLYGVFFIKIEALQ